MKKRLLSLLALSAIFFALICGSAQAVGTVTQAWTHYPNHELSILIVTWVGDVANGTVPATALSSFSGYIIKTVTDPGSPAPTDLYDIVLSDTDGLDVMGGTLMDRSTTVTQQAYPLLATSYYRPAFVCTTVTFTLTNNSVNSATGVLRIYIKRR